ncbi:MAG: hypothetical protein H6869_02005 [Rhodospirillales bacterium]|nr:hypothetical protein [Rhodospirillales bacterium]
MLNAKPTQFKLTDEGVILFQPDATNPLPGQPVARIRKGEAILRPAAEVTLEIAEADQEKVSTEITAWLHGHIDEVLQPLTVLKDEEEIQAPARDIASKLHEAFGILPRAALEEPISGLDEEGRRALRSRKVRLGPVLIFLPLLNKPAAVRLRALLWTLWNDKPLPAAVPPDGVTSISVAEQADIDPVYYRAIGYPVYGPRAIRVDMLDRLISAVYDNADKGVFKAKHEMAEWLGCPIPDLYAVLEAMDHKKIHDPAEEALKDEEAAAQESKVEAEEKPAAPAEEKTETPVPAAAEPQGQMSLFDAPPAAAEDSKDEKPAEAAPKAEQAAPPEKPELATFRLRKGKAYGRPPEQRKKPEFKDNKDRPKRPHKPKKGGPRKEPRERVISAAAKKNVEDSPFAVLKGLKVQNKE